MIEFQDVAVRYRAARNREVQAVDGVTLKIAAGEWVFFVGATGAGKSTLLKLVYAGAQATSGRVIVDGRDVTNLPPHQIPWLRRKLGVVFQDFQLLEQKTVWENVAFALQVTGTPRHKLSSAVAQALDTVGLSHRAQARPRELSGGEQQRAAIARAIVNDPLILLADEPTGNLDPHTGSEIAEVLKRVHERGTTVVMATHDHALVDAMRRRVVRFAQGKLVSDESEGAYLPADTPQGWAAQKGETLVRAILDNEDERDRLAEEKRAEEERQEDQRAAEQRREATEAASRTEGTPRDAPDSESSEEEKLVPAVNPSLNAQRPWEGRGSVHPALKNSAPLGSPENPLVVGVDSDDLKLGQ